MTCSHFALAGPQWIFNLNKENGLPSNNVYVTLVDRNGYLWFGTEKGVVKYNGYDMKTFRMEDGLPNDDVWYMVEDLKGRIWLSSIAQRIGYIKNDKFSLVELKYNNEYMRPNVYKNTPIGVSFVHSSDFGKYNLFFEKDGKAYNLYDIYKGGHLTYLPERNAVYNMNKNGIFKVDLGHLPSRQEVVSHVPITLERGMRKFHFGKYFIADTRYYWIVHDITTGNRKWLHMFPKHDEYERNMYITNDILNVVSNLNLYQLDSNLNLISKKSLKTINGWNNSKPSIIYAIQDNLWGQIYTTQNTGALLASDDVNTLNSSNDRVVEADNIDPMRYVIDPDYGKIFSPKSSQVINKDSTLVFSNKGIFWFNSRTNTYADYLGGQKVYEETHPLVKEREVFVRHQLVFKDIKEFPVTNRLLYINSNLYLLTSTHGLVILTHGKKGFSFKMLDVLDVKKYSDFVYHKNLGLLFIWGETVLSIYNFKDKYVTASHEDLNRVNITKIEDLHIEENSGDIFIKDRKKLFRYSISKCKLTEVRTPLNLEEASIKIERGKLIAAGRAGILIYKVNNGRLNEELLLTNIKKRFYSTIKGWDIVKDKILLSTDSGSYSISINDDSLNTTVSYVSPAKFNISYGDTSHTINSDDTIILGSHLQPIELDVINPHGTGKLVLKYKIVDINDQWNTLDGKTLYLTNLRPGIYYKVIINAADAVWQSDDVLLYLYIMPTFWQTSNGKALQWAGGIIAATFLVLTGVVTTGRILRRRQAAKTKQLEFNNLRLNVELKSIYAQINPHFIFNTLSTTNYFIRKNQNKEAVDHINTFSNLLRSYIDSTQKKFITIDKEIANLENYISLQRIRFENSFDYEIFVDKEIDSSDLEIPAFLLQPLVENAINHGLMHKVEEEGRLTIQFKVGKTDNELLCIIDDDGIGRKASSENYKNNEIKRTSYGSNLINELISVINSANKVFITIEYVDKNLPDTGTTVILKIQYHERKVHMYIS